MGNRPYAFRIGTDAYAQFLQYKRSNGSGGNTADGFPAGGTAASPVIPEAIFCVKGVVRVSRTIIGSNFTVIPGTLGSIGNHQTDRGSRGPSFKDTGKNTYLICFLPGRGIPGLPRLPSVQKGLDIGFAQRKPCGAAVNYHPQSFPVGFAPGGDPEIGSECISCHI